MRLVVVLNILLAVAVLAYAGGAQIIPRSWFSNCCQIDGGGEDICCKDCCLRLWDECQEDWNCEPER